MKNKKFDLKEEYENSWNYIKSSKKFIYLIIFISLFFVFIGFFIPAPHFLSEYISNYIKNLVQQTENFSYLEWIKFIFLNNLQSSFFGIFLGIVLGIFPIIGATFNGYILGFVGALSVKEEGFFVLWRILPHGIFELPAIFISLGLGLRLGFSIFDKKTRKNFRKLFYNSFKIFILIILPLLLIAAIIEGTFIFFAG